MQTLVLFDLGHTGRTGGKPAAEWQGLREDLLVWEYVFYAVKYLRTHGIDATCTGPGGYLGRQQRAVELGARVYVACHVNAGAQKLLDADNALAHTVFYDHRATDRGGKGLANAIVAACAASAPSTSPWRTRPCQPAPHWTKNAHYLIRETGNAAAVTFEPGFIDAIDHQWLWAPSGLEKLGLGLGRGILDYLDLS